MSAKEKVEKAYDLFLQVMHDEGYVYYDTDREVSPEPTWIEIVRTEADYSTITYAVPNLDWKEPPDA